VISGQTSPHWSARPARCFDRAAAGATHARKTQSPHFRRSCLPPPCRSSRIAASTSTFEPSLGKDKDKLAEIIGNYDGLAIRSATKATAKILAEGDEPQGDRPRRHRRRQCRDPGRDQPRHHRDEHALRQFDHHRRARDRDAVRARPPDPAADASTQAGKWEKNRFMGVEITAKTLGMIGCGNIGSIVAERAIGLKMKRHRLSTRILSPERAVRPGRREGRARRAVEARRLHHAAHADDREDQEHHRRPRGSPTKKGVRIVNCARGGLVDRGGAGGAAIKSGNVAGAAFDVFSVEPAEANVLFGLDNVVCTPHLGASTNEAQENVALQVAEQMSDYLLKGAITNAVNFPSISAEEAPRIKPFVDLAEKLGSFARPAHRGGRSRASASSTRARSLP
jgi:D-3-phosphoglycerate dehydrogenase